MRLAIFLLLISISFNAYSADIQQLGVSKDCKIVNVDDGDTVSLLCLDNNKMSYIPDVRLLGINAPDVGVNGKNHCYYKEAKQKISTYKGKYLDVDFYGSDICKDPHKGCRNLVILREKSEEKSINQKLIEEGYFFSWVSFSNFPSNLKEEYGRSEIKSRISNKGLWNSCKVIYNTYSFNSNKPFKMTNF